MIHNLERFGHGIICGSTCLSVTAWKINKTQLLFHRGVQLQHYDEVQHVGPHEEVVGVVGLIALLIVPSRYMLLASCGGRTMLPSHRDRGNRRLPPSATRQTRSRRVLIHRFNRKTPISGMSIAMVPGTRPQN